MCWEDIKIGRGTYAKSKVVSVANSLTELYEANPYRRAVIISAPNANRLTIGISPALADFQGIVLYAQANNVFLNVEEHGPLVQGALKAILSTATAQSIGVTEIIFNTDTGPDK